jgi:hypothetical protein
VIERSLEDDHSGAWPEVPENGRPPEEW